MKYVWILVNEKIPIDFNFTLHYITYPYNMYSNIDGQRSIGISPFRNTILYIILIISVILVYQLFMITLSHSHLFRFIEAFISSRDFFTTPVLNFVFLLVLSQKYIKIIAYATSGCITLVRSNILF